MSGVTRFYRVLADGVPRYVCQREGDEARLVDGTLFGDWAPGAPISLEGRRLLAPLVPGKLIGIGLNYRDHALERKKPIPAHPLVFLKPPSAVIGPGETIVLPPGVGRVDHEAEFAIVIGRRARRVTGEDARAHLFGFTCVNGLTPRALQDAGIQYSHAKGYDTFAPLGPCIATGLDDSDLEVSGTVNGVVRQRSTTAQLIFGVDSLIAYISAIMTLEPGDVIATGTPAGIAPLQAGDEVVVRVAGVGALANPVVAG